MPDLWGLAAMNHGVLAQKCGDYDKARELFSEALALFAAVKHSEYQLAALFNMAHVERELEKARTILLRVEAAQKNAR